MQRIFASVRHVRSPCLEVRVVSITRCSLATLAVLLAACADAARPVSVDDTASIVNGTPTGAAYGAVGALLYDYDRNGVIDGNDEVCSGSLITPTIFLTAAHCVLPDAFIPAGAQFYVSFAPALYAGGITAIPALATEVDPEFGGGEADRHDLAVVVLPEGSTAGITPLSLPPVGALTALAAKNGLNDRLFVNVGYGTSATRTGKASFPFDGRRQLSLAPFMALRPTWLGLLMNAAVTGLGGDCYGDSGGPKFLQGDATTIYAIVITGDMNCRATSWNWRLDTPEARGFLSRFVTLP